MMKIKSEKSGKSAKKAVKITIASVIAGLFLMGCNDRGGEEAEYYLYSAMIFGAFDTGIMIRLFAQTQEDFDRFNQIIRDELTMLHTLFDIYNTYTGINNIRTINLNAGNTPVQVDQKIIDLIKMGKESYRKSGGAVNIALGSVLTLWHDFRSGVIPDPPTEAELAEAALHTNITDIIINEAESTVFLQNPYMSLDVGGIAKGFALEHVAARLRAEGFRSGIISAGGDVRAIGSPFDGRDYWAVGIEDPIDRDGVVFGEHIAVVEIADIAIFTSGSYARFIVHDGMRLHHIIDPATLWPADRFASVTVIHDCAKMAEILSTALFILPKDCGQNLLDNYGGEALWVLYDGTTLMSPNFEQFVRQR